MTDVIQITDENGIRTIDLTPVNKYMDLLRQSFNGEYPLMNSPNPKELFELAHSMDVEQLRYLVSNLGSMLRKKVLENRYLFTKSGLKRTCQLRKMVKIADKHGLDLWTDNNELRE